MAIWNILAGPVKALVGEVGNIIDGLHTSEEEKAEAKAKILSLDLAFQRDLLVAETEAIKAGRDVVVAEAKGESWLQRSWRPLTMLAFVFIVVNNFIVTPYVTAFGGNVPTLDIPAPLWSLLTVGIGGYVVGRSAEKAVKYWKNGGK